MIRGVGSNSGRFVARFCGGNIGRDGCVTLIEQLLAGGLLVGDQRLARPRLGRRQCNGAAIRQGFALGPGKMHGLLLAAKAG